MSIRSGVGEGRAVTVRRAALALGPIAFTLSFVVPAPAGMPLPAWNVAGLAFWMTAWWSTEAVSIPVTALLPVVVLPLASTVGIATAASPYANPLIFLFLGGFLLALGIQRWNLHQRIALMVITRLGTRPTSLVASFMAATGLISMWVSNTATAMLMLPIALSVAAIVSRSSDKPDPDDPFSVALLLGVAYGASIGGMATLIGTPPNALLAAFAQDRLGIRIGFAQWMAVGVPAALLLGLAAWLTLTRVIFRLSGQINDNIHRDLALSLNHPGALTRPERRVATIFAFTAVAWLAQPLLATIPGLGGLTDTSIALIGGMALFVVPPGIAPPSRLLAWSDAASLPWGTLLLVGGGLSLAEAITHSGLALWIGSTLGFTSGWTSFAIVALVAGVVVLLTELTSNTATTAAFLPVMAILAASLSIDPLLLMVPVALAASAAFMLPVATPPNAVVHGSGKVTIPQMMRAGALLNLATIVILTFLLPFLVPLIFVR